MISGGEYGGFPVAKLITFSISRIRNEFEILQLVSGVSRPAKMEGDAGSCGILLQPAS
jgi:hypothetical protein